MKWSELRHYGPTNSRFDHHSDGHPTFHPDRGILYAAEKPAATFGEFFQDTRTIHRRFRRPWIVQFALAEPVSLLDLTGGWMLKIGGGASIAAGEREQARKWSRVFYEAFPSVDGLCYRSSLNPDWIAFALYERSGRSFPAQPLFQASLKNTRVRPLIAQAAAECGYDVV